jgi:hypothetical protein
VSRAALEPLGERPGALEVRARERLDDLDGVVPPSRAVAAHRRIEPARGSAERERGPGRARATPDTRAAGIEHVMVGTIEKSRVVVPAAERWLSVGRGV